MATDGFTVSLDFVAEAELLLPATSFAVAVTVMLLEPSASVPGLDAVASSVTEYVPELQADVPDFEFVPSETLTVTLPEIPEVASEHVPETT